MSDSIQYKSIGFHNMNNRKSLFQMYKDIYNEDPQNPIIEKINKNNQAIDKNDKPIEGEFGWFNSSFAPVRSFGKGVVHGTGELIEGGVGGTVAGFVTAPYGYYTGDYTLDLEDPHHKEYKDAYDYVDEYKKTVNPFISGEDGNKLLLDYRSDEYPEGFKNSFFGGTGLQTRRSPETQLKAIQGNSIIQGCEFVNDFIIETSNVNTWGAVDDTYMNSFFQSVPNLLTQVALSRINPGYGMTYASAMMYSGSYMEAKPFVEAGELSVNDAVSLAQLTATTSWLWNAGPSHFWATKPNSVGLQKIFFNQLKNITHCLFHNRT